MRTTTYEVAKLETEKATLDLVGTMHEGQLARHRELKRLLSLPRETALRGSGKRSKEVIVVIDREGPTTPEPAEPPRPRFAIGDVVQLKSGGHEMTVTGMCCCGAVEVTYSNGTDMVDGSLPGVCLRLAEPADIPF